MNSPESGSYNLEVTSMPYLLFMVGKNIYAISSEIVRNIEVLAGITTMAETGPNIRGGVIYQNTFIYLLDMRKIFGLHSLLEEFEESVQPEQRIKDHEKWVDALDKSVRSKTEFTLTDDPHQCAFGRWFYSFETSNNVLKYQLNKIEAPHEAVHKTAKMVKKLMQENKYEMALSEIEKMRTTHYAVTRQILSSLRETVANTLKELYIVIESDGCMKGIIVDSVVGVECLDDRLQVPEAIRSTRYVQFIGRRKNDNALVIILNNQLLKSTD